MRRLNKWVRALIWVLALILCMAGTTLFFYLRHNYATDRELAAERIQMRAIQGENQEITGDYDPALAVTCDNGTFVGQAQNGVLACKGIPYALPPVEKLRWQPPVDAEPDNRVYEALYFGNSCIQTESYSERASLYEESTTPTLDWEWSMIK